MGIFIKSTQNFGQLSKEKLGFYHHENINIDNLTLR